jgi:hypothetical protein
MDDVGKSGALRVPPKSAQSNPGVDLGGTDPRFKKTYAHQITRVA